MDKVTPFLWFDGTAEQAATFYVSLFDDARIVSRTTIDRAGPNRDLTVQSLTFEIAGRQFHAFNGGPAMAFSPAISLMIDCETQSEVDAIWARMLDGGTPQRCGWITDKFGVTWQVVPRGLREMLGDPDPAKAGRAMQAMLRQTKLDIGAICGAVEGN